MVSKYAKASEDALYFSRKIIRKGGTWGGHVKISGSLRTAEEAAKKEQQSEWLDEYSLTRSYLIHNLEKLHDQIKKEMVFSPSECDKLDDLFWYSKIAKVLNFFKNLLNLEDLPFQLI